MTDSKLPPGYIPLTHHHISGGSSSKSDHRGRGDRNNGYEGRSRSERQPRNGSGPDGYDRSARGGKRGRPQQRAHSRPRRSGAGRYDRDQGADE